MLLTILLFWILLLGIRISFRIVTFAGRMILWIVGLAILLPFLILFGFGLFGLVLIALMVPMILVIRLH